MDDNQQKEVDELNYGMEMELDKSEIQQINDDLVGMQNTQSEESKEGCKKQSHGHQHAGTFCQECNTHHSAVDSYSGHCQYDGSEDPNDEEFQEEDD